MHGIIHTRDDVGGDTLRVDSNDNEPCFCWYCSMIFSFNARVRSTRGRIRGSSIVVWEAVATNVAIAFSLFFDCNQCHTTRSRPVSSVSSIVSFIFVVDVDDND